jgi:hypothetical protein
MCYGDTSMNTVNRFNLRLPETLRGVIEKRAEERMRSINNELLVLLKMGLVNETVEPQALSAADKLIAQEQKNKRKTSTT